MDLRLFCVFAVAAAVFPLAYGSTRYGGAYYVSNADSLSVGESVDYEMRTASAFSSHLFASLKEEAASHLPQALLLFVSTPAAADPVSLAIAGTSGSSTEVSASGRADSLAGLKKVFQLAPAKTFFTSVGESCNAQSIKDALRAEAEAPGSIVSQVRLGGSCSKDENQETIEDFLHSWDSVKSDPTGLTLLVFCQSHSPSHSSTSPDSPSELFYKAYVHLQNTTSRFAALFVPEGPASSRATCTRSLVEAFPPPAANGTCDSTCMTKASLWEAGLVSIVLLIALVSGLCCLVDLDSPTRFEAERESS